MPGKVGFSERLSVVRSFRFWLWRPLGGSLSGSDPEAQVPVRVVLMTLLAVFGVIAYVVMASDGYILAQEDGTTTPSATEPTGKLVVAPRPVEVGEKPVAVGFHVEPADLEVTLEYSEHFVPDGESCTGYTASRTTTPQAAPTWITLKACSEGKGYVRLIASNGGQVIEEVSVTVDAAGSRVPRQAATRIQLSGVASQLTVGGSSDSFTVSAFGLNTSAEFEYDIHVVSLNERLAFDSGCTNHDESYTARGQISFGEFVEKWGCMPPGSILWAYMDSYEDGDRVETVSTELTDNYVEIVCPTEGCAPTISGAQSVSYNENGTSTVAIYTAEDADGDNVTWSLSGTDSDDLSIGSSSGALTFDSPPNYESPTDAGRNNVYNVKVVATDDSSSALSSTLDVTVTVTDVNEAPVFANTTTTFNVPENSRAVATKSATDEDSADSVTYALSGTDADLSPSVRRDA